MIKLRSCHVISCGQVVHLDHVINCGHVIHLISCDQMRLCDNPMVSLWITEIVTPNCGI